ncbi:hypothetical protein BX666DRAFT_2021610 [Dichotomocladium elegans]|nr:hypothetical protein BX666DRAFT_2021610 [Dichotomocladium elegans]
MQAVTGFLGNSLRNLASLVSWQTELSIFFKGMGLLETSRCFQNELVILSRQHLAQLPSQLEHLVDRLLQCLEQHVEAKEAAQSFHDPSAIQANRDKMLYCEIKTNKKKRKHIEEEYIVEDKDEDNVKAHSGDEEGENIEEGEEEEEEQRMARLDPEQVQIRASKKQVEQRIQTFIAAKQAEVDASNRTEFLNRADPTSTDITCARADAREINRNIQMKFDIVNNEDGPLARSTLSSSSVPKTGQEKQISDEGHCERIDNISAHLNLVFDTKADPPFTSVPERLRVLEDRLMAIERENPPWAAAHFAQPNQPATQKPKTVIITRPGQPIPNYIATEIDKLSTTTTSTTTSPILKTTGRANSSLTRAVLEQLHRQRQASPVDAATSVEPRII